MFGPLGLVGQQFVRFLDSLELVLALASFGLVLYLVGMALEDQLPVGGADFGCCRIFGDTEDSIWIGSRGDQHVGTGAWREWTS